MLEKKGKTPALYGEGIMKSVECTEEEVKLNTPVPTPYTVPYFSSSPPFFPQLSNPSAKGSMKMCQRK